MERMMAKSAAKKKEPKRVVLETPFAGVAAGSILYVATPDIVADYVRKIRPGTTRSIPQMRRDLAKKNKADATCPVSTAIFLRSVAEVSLKQMTEGMAAAEATPFWRIVDPGSPIDKRLGLEAEWIDAQRAMELA
jgi:hypothetical protein